MNHCVIFSQPEARSAMQEGIGVVKGQLGRLWPPVAGPVALERPPPDLTQSEPPGRGRWYRPAADRAMSSKPSGRQATRGRLGVAATERVKVLQAAASLMRARRETLAAWEVLECGKS